VPLPFTNDQFFSVFAEYNRSFVFVVAVLWFASIGILAYVARSPADRSNALSVFLGALWLWNAVAYHALLFARINSAAWLFASLFVVQGLLFWWVATRKKIEYVSSVGWMRVVGVGLILYALAYPFLTTALGHPYPATPTFGVPCPTAILTIGLLMTVRGGVPVTLSIIPVVWGFIGGSAAVLLTVPTDYALLGAGLLLAVIVPAQHLRPMSIKR
jgi:hypothetical protein